MATASIQSNGSNQGDGWVAAVCQLEIAGADDIYGTMSQQGYQSLSVQNPVGTVTLIGAAVRPAGTYNVRARCFKGFTGDVSVLRRDLTVWAAGS
jgi:hypothetical protein